MYLSLYQNNVYRTQQGLEKYSDRAPEDFFRSTNHKGGRYICPQTTVSEVKQDTVPLEGQRTFTNINLLLFVKTAWNVQL